MTAAELLEELGQMVQADDDRPVVTDDGKPITLVTRYEDAIVLKTS